MMFFLLLLFTRSNNLTITAIFAIIIALDGIFMEISQSESIRQFLIWIKKTRVRQTWPRRNTSRSYSDDNESETYDVLCVGTYYVVYN